MIRHFPFAASEAAILPNLCPISKPSGYSDENARCSTPDPVHFLLSERCGGRLPAPWRSSNCLLSEIVMFFAYRDTQPRCTNGGGTPNRWIRSRIAANSSRGTATLWQAGTGRIWRSSTGNCRQHGPSVLRLGQNPVELRLWSRQMGNPGSFPMDEKYQLRGGASCATRIVSVAS